MGYIKEILTGDYSNYCEDRLSQLFSASFNNSEIFKKIFFNVIKEEYKSGGKYSSRTQKYYSPQNENARIDIIIDLNERPIIIIENKVESSLTSHQLEKYNTIQELRGCSKYAIVKHYFENIAKNAGWTIYHWADFYVELKKKHNNHISNQSDNFIISNFIEHLELMQMTRVNIISQKKLMDFSGVLKQIRNEKKPSVALAQKNFFETGNQITAMLEEIVNRVRQEDVLITKIGTSFRYTPRLNWWYEDEKHIPDHRDIGIYVFLPVKNSKNEIACLGTGIFFYNKNPKKYTISIYASDKNEEWKQNVTYKKRDLIFEDYAKQVISNWKKWVR